MRELLFPFAIRQKADDAAGLTAEKILRPFLFAQSKRFVLHLGGIR
jgi:hypothetical protein